MSSASSRTRNRSCGSSAPFSWSRTTIGRRRIATSDRGLRRAGRQDRRPQTLADYTQGGLTNDSLSYTRKLHHIDGRDLKRSAKIVKLQPPLRCAEPTPTDMELEADDITWAARSGMWQNRVEKASARRTKRAKAQPALILAGYGVSLRVENGALTIRNGFTHYPQKREIIRYFPGDVALPQRIILLDGSGSISFDVLSWLAEQNVSFIRIDWKGDIVCVAGASGYSANPHRVRWQLETRENPDRRNEFCRSIIIRKIEAAIITLEKSIPRSDKWERAMRSAYSALTRLDENPPEANFELCALTA